jgi:hypothetical protein
MHHTYYITLIISHVRLLRRLLGFDWVDSHAQSQNKRFDPLSSLFFVEGHCSSVSRKI